MNRFLAALTALGLAGGCADPAGDLAAAPAVSGKEDAWDSANDPARLAQQLTYRLSDLPRTGKLDKPVWASRYPTAVAKAPVAWADTFWPSAALSTNARWQGRDVRSPLEKYDAAAWQAPGCEAQPASTCGPSAKAAWDAYRACAGPSAKWHINNFQSIGSMFDGVDNDGQNGADSCDANDDEGPQSWWGLCHAWAPASLLEPEPQRAVEWRGQRFEIGDIKALLQTVYDRSDAVMIGGRCNGEHFAAGESANSACQDLNPGALHVALTNFIGINDQALIEDRVAGSEVWNQPIVGYSITQQEKITATRANQLVGASGPTWAFNPDATALYEVELTIDYLVEGNASRLPLGMAGYVSHDSVHYVLEVGAAGTILGGRYATDSVGDHPDFVWAPIAPSVSSYGRNPNVKLEDVRELVRLSLEAADVPRQVVSYASTESVAIPDNDPAGARLDVVVPDDHELVSVVIKVDVEHPWIGDLKIEVLHDGQPIGAVDTYTDGGGHDYVRTYNLTRQQLGISSTQGTWTLRAVDGTPQDSGRLRSFSLDFTI